MKSNVCCVLTLISVFLFASLSFAGGGPKTIELVMKNRSETSLKAKDGYCKYYADAGVSHKKDVDFSGTISPNSSKRTSIELDGQDELIHCRLYAVPSGGTPDFEIRGHTDDEDETDFYVYDRHVEECLMGHDVTVKGK